MIFLNRQTFGLSRSGQWDWVEATEIVELSNGYTTEDISYSFHTEQKPAGSVFVRSADLETYIKVDVMSTPSIK